MASSTRTVNVKFDGDAQGLRRAARDGEREVDRFSKSVDKKFRTSGDDSGKGFSKGLKKWFSPSALKDLKKSGEFGGSLFGSGLLGALKTPVLGPALVATLAAVVATALPAIGAVAASGLIAGFGAGLAGLGIVFAAKSQAVKDIWSKTLKGMGDDMTKLSRPFEATLISIAGFAQRTFDKFKPALESAFKDIAPTVTRFVDQVSKGLEQLAPAIGPISDAFNAVLDSLGPAIQSAIGSVSDGLRGLADSVKKNPDGLSDLVRGLGDITKEALGFITTLNDVNGKFKNLTGGVSLVTVVMKGLEYSLGPLIGLFQGVSKALDLINNATKPVGDGFHYTATSAEEAAKFSSYLTQGLDDNQLALLGITGAAPKTGKEVESLAAKFDRQWQATQKANQELFRNSGLLLSLSGSEISYQAAVDAATESVKQNGHTHDINTEKGRANKTALDQMAASANAQSEASRNAGKASVESATNAQKAYEKQAVQMGYTKQEAHRMALEFINIPKKTQADFKGDITDLDSKIKTAKKQLADPHLSATKKAKLEAYIGQLLAEKKKAQDAIDSLHGKTVPVVFRYSAVGVAAAVAASTRGGGKRASGGPVQPNRSYLINERGPEVLTMGPNGSFVTSAEKVSELNSGQQPLIVENHIEIGGEVVRVVRTEIKQNDANTKRRVQAGVRA